MIAEPLVEVRCTVCGGDEHRPVCSSHEIRAHQAYLRRFHMRRLRHPSEEALADRADFTQDYATNVVACHRCGLVFRSPRPPAAAIERAYSEDQYGHRRLSSMFEAQVELYRPKARSLARCLDERSRVVEVGSFVGGFLAAGKERGWEMLGVDPGEEVDTFCAERGLPVFRGALPDLLKQPHRDWPPGSVDCVAIWNAFDQLPDPEPTLDAARRLLRPGGLLALRVPNGACFEWSMRRLRRLPHPFAGWLRAALAWNNMLAFPYLHGYTISTLDRLVAPRQLKRARVVPDTLCRLADSTTRPWAAAEEAALKWVVRCAARIDAWRTADNLVIAPWFDAYFRAI